MRGAHDRHTSPKPKKNRQRNTPQCPTCTAITGNAAVQTIHIPQAICNRSTGDQRSANNPLGSVVNNDPKKVAATSLV